MEDENAEEESSQFLYYDEAVKVFSELFDHTNDDAIPEGPGGPGGPGGDPGGDPDAQVPGYATRLLGGNTDEIYGLAKSLQVMPGDVINVEVFAKYIDTDPQNWSEGLEALIAAISAGTAPAGTFVDGGASGSLGNNTLPFAALDHGSETGSAPKAYLNWILVDVNQSPVPLDFGFRRLSTVAREYGQNIEHERLAFDGEDRIEITQPGYLYIYLSNENDTPVEVFFDDFKVEYIGTELVQAADYYPFGLVHGGDLVEQKYRYGYQGQFSEKDLTTGMQEFEIRMYDPRIGRWLSPDPYGQFASPYVAMGNIPHMGTDPDGSYCPECLEAFIKAGGKIGPEVTITATRLGTQSLGQGAILGAVGSIGVNLSSSMSGGGAIEFGQIQNYEPSTAQLARWNSPIVDTSIPAPDTSPLTFSMPSASTIQSVAGYAGLIPGLNTVAGIVEAGAAIVAGNYWAAGLAVAGAIPVVGVAVKLGKLGLLASRTTRIYRIWDNSTGTVWKYGVSSGFLGKNFTLWRLQSQVNKLNKVSPNRFTGTILSTHPNRPTALFYERVHTAIYRETTGNIPQGMKFPQGNFPIGY